jgi:hypothetical protein
MIIAHALDAVAVANELLQAKKEDGKPVLDYKKIKLAHSLGRVVDTLTPDVTRCQKSREALLDELGDKYVGFSSEAEIDGAEKLEAKLNPEQSKEHEGRFLYQLPAEEFEKLDKKDLKVIDAGMHKFSTENAKLLNTAIDELLSQETDCSIRISIEAFEGFEYENIVQVILGLHEIVEGI